MLRRWGTGKLNNLALGHRSKILFHAAYPSGNKEDATKTLGAR